MPNPAAPSAKASALALLLALAALFAPFAAPSALAQSAVAVARLDPNQLIGSYYTIARTPSRRFRACQSRDLVLYALGDKRNTLQIVTTCQAGRESTLAWSSKGRFSKAGDGRIRLGWIWPFASQYWVLSLAPDASWALVGTPNHRSLSILARTTILGADTLSAIEATATAQGFNIAKLVKINQVE